MQDKGEDIYESDELQQRNFTYIVVLVEIVAQQFRQVCVIDAHFATFSWRIDE